MSAASNSNDSSLYLDLLEAALLDTIYSSEVSENQHWNSARAGQQATDAEIEGGQYWPARAHTMIGRRRLRNFRTAIETIITDHIAGDILEAGVWRGGASIYARGVLKALGDNSRKVYVADSFEGLPKPDQRYPADQGDQHWKIDFLKASLEEVKANFSAYDLLDEQVVFVEGFFENTLSKYSYRLTLCAQTRWRYVRFYHSDTGQSLQKSITRRLRHRRRLQRTGELPRGGG